MDPIGAVSLASNVVQLLDFGIKLVSKAHDIYTSAEGAEVHNIELDAIAQNLIALNRRLQNRSRKVCAYAVSEDEKALESLTVHCNQIGEELIKALQAAKVQGAHKHWKSVRQALKSTLGRDEIQELYNRLKQYREQIVVVLLVITNAKQTALDENVDAVRHDIIESESRILDEARQTRFQILNAIRHSNYNPSKQEDVSTVSRLLSEMVSRGSEKKIKEEILDSLYYPNMQDRREWISAAHKKTFSWTLEDNAGKHIRWDSLKHWLCRGKGIYWLSGKAGSGKSTLMKYIDQDQRTSRYLEQWAWPQDIVFASFYFWNPGTSMQKSQLGLLQSLLHKILSQKPSLIPQVLPAQVQQYSTHGTTNFSWAISQLKNAFKLLLDTKFDTKFCFLIDGLDEYDGDHQNLVDMLIDMSRGDNIKILAASRPWLLFQDAFRECPKLTLQDLTHDDIKAFTHDSLYNHPRFSRALSMEPERAPKLVTEIVNKASGVFLWVYLVVRSLMEGLTNADRMDDLQRRLDQIPADLEQFFFHMLSGLDKFYLKQASQLFRLALEAPKPLAVLTFSYLDESDPDFALKSEIKPMSKEEEVIRCEEIERRLNSRCKGLLESRRRRSCDSYSNADGVVDEVVSYEVDFLHRTVRDFLGTPTVGVRLVALDTSEFDANMTLARAYVARIKSLRRSAHSEGSFQALWALVFDMLYHIRLVGKDISRDAQVCLLDELNRAAAHFREAAIVKRRCDPTAHWVNTGYRFGFEPAWNNDFITLCVQYELIPYLEQKLPPGTSLHRPGKPLLAFALTTTTPLDPNTVRQLEGVHYHEPRVKMVEFLLGRGATPNDMDGGETVWVRCIVSIFLLTLKAKDQFSEQAKSWFEITKLLLLRGADPQAICPANTQGKSSDVNSNGLGTRKSTAMDLISIVFGGDSRFDISDLEDAIEQPERAPPLPPATRYVSDSFLQIPGAQNHDGTHVSRSHSAASSASHISWDSGNLQFYNTPGSYANAGPLASQHIPHRVNQEVGPGGGIPIVGTPSYILMPAPNNDSIPTVPKKKRHSRLSSLFSKIKPREKTPPGSAIYHYQGT
ncbi:hypothetical protein GX51_01043 [Blastomyces parvus]|uniref:Uncharacterized protein n=1 Tax=Blastomyces parvus TaxID=2060905 RepID=A0A2B7XIN7_9EURO|nr:hypothetical protein GX51_01043 [Blastomyces parvus]